MKSKKPSKDQQLTFFKSAGNPLEQRLGKDFFDELPKDPGVYKMFGRRGRLLYVGKAKNLRTRLFCYRRVKSEHRSQKTKRLVQAIHKIEYDTCKSEQAALLKENALIRTRKPEFNRAKKSPETYYFLSVVPGQQNYQFRLSTQMPEAAKGKYIFGAFKGHRTVRKGTGALIRQLYVLDHQVETPFDFPSVLMKNLTPLTYNLVRSSQELYGDDLWPALELFLKGKSLHFLRYLVEIITERNLLSGYMGRLVLKDLQALRRFYDYCLNRNGNIIDKFNLSSSIIPQNKLDDYLIRLAFLNKGS